MSRSISFFIIILIIHLFIDIQAFAQTNKKIIDQSVYADWKLIRNQSFSNNGKFISYEINPQHKGDGFLFLKDIESSASDSFPRGTRARFSPNSNFIAFLVKPQADSVRQAKIDGKKKDEMPNDSLFIYVFSDKSITKFSDIKSFSIAEEETDWLVFSKKLIYDDDKEDESENNEDDKSDEDKPENELIIFNPIKNIKHSFFDKDSYKISENGKLIAFTKTEDDSVKIVSIKIFNTADQSTMEIFSDTGKIKSLTVDNSGTQLSFLFAKNIDDDDEKQEIYNLYYFSTEKSEKANQIVDINTDGVPKNWSVSEHSNLKFSDNGKRLYFGTAPIPDKKQNDSIPEDEKYKLDIWHWQDTLIQPHQLVNLDNELKRTYKSVYHISENKIIQLANKQIPNIRLIKKGDGDIALGTTNLHYVQNITWSAKNYHDFYLIDINTGKSELILEKDIFHTSLSPDGKFLINYNYTDSCWYSINTKTKVKVNLSESLEVDFFNIHHDRPTYPSPYGIAGWVENESYVLIYDHHDIWKFDPSGKKEPKNLTNNYGRENNLRFRYIKLNPDDDYIKRRETILLSAFNYQNKQSGFYNIRVNRAGNPQKIIMEDMQFSRPIKAKDADILAWKKSSFNQFPDLWISDTDFNNSKIITNANPQQKEYRWGNAELVEWVSFNNDTLQGILYTPENLNPEKKYPMIVYFYERSSQDLNRHFIPSPSRSTINRPHYLSNGYVVFVPDINPYIEGYPGHTAYNAVVSGTQAVLERYEFIDRDNIGLQGQSWGGYQIAYLITRTNMFKAAMAGAPVSNMISAYGGIRWSSGRSRQFQYEDTQSRIGGTPWQKHIRYVENSPIFYADRIETPLLIMHNDNDGAVPWYQGIELFMAMRRLDKPVWMLNYNDEAHNLRNWPNRMDLDIRMMQFFDYYLKNSPAPEWLKYGIPAIKKGKTDGYKLVE